MALMETILSIHNALPSASNDNAEPPEWVQVLPVGEFYGDDGRGPFLVGEDDAQNIIQASFARHNKLPLDVNHSTDVALKGDETPARGWIVELQLRESGIWGRVEWTNKGRQIMLDKEYGFISPAIMHTEKTPHKVSRILRASLVNDPNFNMKSLHNRGNAMSFLEKVRKELGLDENADEDTVISSLHQRLETAGASSTTLTAIAKALDVDDKASSGDLITSLNSRLAETNEDEVVTLRNEVKSLNTQLNEVVSNHAKERAETVIDAAITDCKIVPAMRDHMVTRHIKDPEGVELEIKHMVSLNSGGLGHRPTIETDEGKLNAADSEVCSMMGLDPEAFAKQSKKLGLEVS